MLFAQDESFTETKSRIKFWLRFVLSITLMMAVVGIEAQKPSNGPGIDRIVQERDRTALERRDFQWSPAGGTVAFINTVAGPTKGPRAQAKLEIRGGDEETGKQSVLVSTSDLLKLFGPEPRKLPGEEEEDAVPRTQLLNYSWASDGRSMLLATKDTLGWFNLDAHTGRILLHGDETIGDSKISPDGRSVSFVRDHTLWIADVQSGTTHQVSRTGTADVRKAEPDWLYREELQMRSAYWWAPDSHAIAWVEIDDRGVDKYTLRKSDGDQESFAYPKPGKKIPHLHLVVGLPRVGTTHSIDLGSDANVYIPLVRWLPDGKHIAFARLSRNQKTLELLIADVVTGKSHVVVTEKDDYWINLSDDLRFLKDSKRFLWSSERTGFRHLYLYDTTGRELAQLTKGDWEVSSVAGVDEDKGRVYFIGTETSPLERQLYAANLDGSGFSRITQRHGTHDARLSPDNRTALDEFSDRLTPPEFDLLGVDGTEIAKLSINSKGEPPRLLCDTEYQTFKTHLGVDLHASITRPPGFNAEKKYPVIFFVAGGPGEQIVRDKWGGDIGLWLDSMAQQGYVIFAIDNRGTSGRGHLFEEPVHLRFSSQDMADVRDGVLYLQTLHWVDQTRIGICGFGYGGFLVLNGMLYKPVLYKAAFAGEPISDWHFYDAFFAERYLDDPDRNQDGWLSSSPLDNAKNLSTPLLVAHATLDEKVHIENSLSLLDALLDNRKYADILLFPDRHSLFDDRGSRTVLFQRMTDFFLKNL